VGLKNQLVPYADDMNLLGDIIDTAKNNEETLNAPSMKTGPEVSAEKVACILLSFYNIAGQNHGIKTAKMPFEKVA
jgi:hypothetical protein